MGVHSLVNLMCVWDFHFIDEIKLVKEVLQRVSDSEAGLTGKA